MEVPETKYATLGGAQIAYQVVGDGPIDLVYSFGNGSNIEVWWDHPAPARFTERLASFSRVILFDQRGSGASDHVYSETLPTWEEWAEDLRAVLDAVGSQRTAILAEVDAGPIAILFAATYPERTTALVLADTAARYLVDEDYPIGITPDVVARVRRLIETTYGTMQYVAIAYPTRAGDERFLRWQAKYQRLCHTPRDAAAQFQHAVSRDIRSVLSTIRVPTLVIGHTNSRWHNIEHSRYLAEHISGARLIEIPAEDTNRLYLDEDDEALGRIEEFLTGIRRPPEPDRVLATLLFTDIVGSTERAAGMGDARWRALLDEHDALARQEIERFRGRAVKSTGDGVLATFDGPARAIRCAVALREAVRSLGVEVRTGLHTGEIELRSEDVGGIAVHIAARVMAHAEAGEVLVSGSVPPLVAGSGIEFDDRGSHDLKGVPGEWRLFAVRT